MDILVDEGPCPIECRPGDPFGRVVSRLREALARDGRVLASLIIDGESPAPERWSVLEAEPIEKVGRVRITTAEPLAAATATLESVLDALPPLRAEQERAVESLQAGRRSEGLSHFRRCVEMWEVIQQSVLTVSRWVAGDLGSQEELAGNIAGAGEALAEALRTIQAALQADDVTALGDVIEVDLDPLIDRWTTMLTALTDRVRAARRQGDGA